MHEGPRTEERRALLCHLPPRKPKSWRIDSDTRSEERHTSPPRPQKGSALPRLSISRERGTSGGVERREKGGGVSVTSPPRKPKSWRIDSDTRSERREKGNAPALPRKVHEGPRTEERRALLCHLPPSKTEVVADRFRHPFRGATHVPTSAPEGLPTSAPDSAATFNFEGTSGGVERREKGRRHASPRKGQRLPRTGERQPFSASPPWNISVTRGQHLAAC